MLFKPEDSYTRIIYETKVTHPSERVLEVADAFGIGINEDVTHVVSSDLRMPDKFDVMYITGMSGSGKSSIIRRIKQDFNYEHPIIKSPKNKPIIDCIGKDVNEATYLLGIVGLGEAMLFLKNYNQLSDGQKYRYRLAKYLEARPSVLILDEFVTYLDRDTARIISYNFQKLCRKNKIKLIVATPHNDLVEYVRPDVFINLNMGDNISVKQYDWEDENIVLKNCEIQLGSMEDYQLLSKYHYVSSEVSFVSKIFKMVYNSMVVGVIVYSTPFKQVIGRNIYFDGKYYDDNGVPRLKEVNKDFLLISRVVVHPMFRGIGAGTHLIKETLFKVDQPFIESLAVMTKYNKFMERAGGKFICNNIREDRQELVNSFSDYLSEYGFDYKLISSKEYCEQVLAKIEVDKDFKSMLYDILTIKFTRMGLEEKYGSKKKFVNKAEITSEILSNAKFVPTEYYLFDKEAISNGKVSKV